MYMYIHAVFVRPRELPGLISAIVSQLKDLSLVGISEEAEETLEFCKPS